MEKWTRNILYEANKEYKGSVLDEPVVHIKNNDKAINNITKNTITPELKKSREAAKLISYSDLYYNRIHIIPNSINFGVLDSTKTFTVEIWNSFLDDNTLINMTGDFDQGLYFQEAIDNVLFKGNSSKLYTLVGDSEGPLTVNADLKANFTYSYGNLHVDAVREIVTFDFDIPLPNYSENISFYTDILRSNNGEEQRIALLQQPRMTNTYNFLLSDFNLSLFESKIEGFLGQTGLTPKWQQSQVLNYEVLAGENNVFFNTKYKDLSVGQYILLKEDNKLETAKIVEIYDDRVVTELTLEKTFSEKAYVIPCFFSYIETINKTNLTDRDAQVSITFKYFPDEIQNISYEGYTFEQYDNLNVFINQPNKTNPIVTSYNRDTLVQDNGYGINTIIDINKQNFNNYNYTYLLESEKEIQQFKSLLFDLNGRQKPFYIPTFQQDLILIKDIEFSTFDQFIIINSVKYKKNYNKNFRHIAIFYKDGTHSLYKVTDAETSDTYTDADILHLDRSLEKITNYDNIEYICFLNKARFVSDDTQINYITNEVAEVIKNIQILKHEEKE